MRGRPFTKGDSRAGRPKGTPNATNAAVRDAFALLLEGNVERLQACIDEVATKDPHKAFGMVMGLAAYVVPKVKAVELTAINDETIIVRFID